jgi:hypothetical protein
MDAAGGLKAPDLVLRHGALCDARCSQNELTLWVHPGNLGGQAVLPSSKPKITVHGRRNGALEPLLEQPLTQPLRGGAYQDSVQLVLVSPLFAEFDALVLRIESDAVECKLDNNELLLAGPLCPRMP